MPLFFFHLRDGVDRLLDPDGQDLPDLAAVQAAALKEARFLVSQEAILGEIRLAQRIEVENEAGAVVHRLGFNEAVLVFPS